MSGWWRPWGEEAAAQRLKSSSLKKKVVDQGLLRPGHIRAAKPLNLVGG